MKEALLDAGRRLRPSEEVALGEVATDQPHPSHLLGGLNALGDHGKTQAVSEVRHRNHDGRILLVASEALNEAPVHLQFIHSELPAGG